MRRTGLIVFVLLAVALLLPPSSAFAAETSHDAKEMAATLRDMLWFPRARASLEPRLFLSAKEFQTTYAPQSAWGRNQLDEWLGERQAAIDQLVENLTRYGDLEAALSPAGFRLPIQKAYIENRKEYVHVDKLLFSFRELDDCDQDAEPPNCYLILKLQKDAAEKMSVRAITLEHPKE